jgi:phenylalanyl-tRNA synthetase beta chain
MKVSLNTIRGLSRRYGCADDIAPDGVDALVEKIGAQLGAVEEVTDFGQKYEGVIVAKVVACVKHPNADKLKICKIDDDSAVQEVTRDENGHVQVVCGAPNVREGLLVAWLPPSTTVPSSVGNEPFVLEAREIRGEISNGMLASPKELALGDSHDGILEITDDIKPGTTFIDAYDLHDDKIIDIENKMFTHRPDCFGFLGVARELAGIQGMPFKSPDWYVANAKFPEVETEELKLSLHNELPELVSRVPIITLRDVKVGPSPTWLQVELAKIGQKSINNIVDYTNFFMQETGQPMHAFDYDKVQALSTGDAATIVVRLPKPGEKIKLLNGKKVEPRPEAIMIATDQEVISIAGVMGGSKTEVDADTKNVILECANFDMYSIRRTSMAHGLFTDAVTRFTKGQSPLQNLAVLVKVVDEIRKHADGKVASQLIDDNHLEPSVLERQSLYSPVTVTTAFINTRLGLELSANEMKTLLENVEFHVEVEGENLTVTAPFWRTDIELREDVVEEVGRLYGFDKLPLELPTRDLTPAVKDLLLEAKSRIRHNLSKAGANEILTYSFVHGGLLEKTGQDKTKAFEISNALSPDLQYYRMSLMPSLLEKIHPNIKAGYNQFALFELGKTHSLDHADDDKGLPREFEFTALVVTGNDKLQQAGAAYYQARKYLQALVNGFTQSELSCKPISDDMLGYPVVQPYDPARSALVSLKGGSFLGIIGGFKPSVARALKLPKYTAGFEVDTLALQLQLSAGASYFPLFKFPSVRQDITLKVAADLSYAELEDFVHKELGANAPDETHIQLDPVDIYQKADDPTHKQFTFRVTITGTDRTLTDKEVSVVLDAIAAAAQNKYSAARI